MGARQVCRSVEQLPPSGEIWLSRDMQGRNKPFLFDAWDRARLAL
jgi:hypothetical protein